MLEQGDTVQIVTNTNFRIGSTKVSIVLNSDFRIDSIVVSVREYGRNFNYYKSNWRVKTHAAMFQHAQSRRKSVLECWIFD